MSITRTLRLMAATVTVATLGGCAIYDKVNDLYRVDPIFDSDFGASSTTTAKDPQIRAYEIFATELGMKLPDLLDQNKASHSQRKNFFQALLSRSDKECTQHQSAILSLSATNNFGFSTLASVFGIAGGLTTAANAARSLAAAAGGASALRGHIQENFYISLLAPAIVKESFELRRKAIEAISAELENPATPVMRGIRLIEEAHDACSFHRAVASLASGRDAAAEQAKVFDAQIATQTARLQRINTEIDNLQTQRAGASGPRLAELNSRLAELRVQAGAVQTFIDTLTNARMVSAPGTPKSGN